MNVVEKCMSSISRARQVKNLNIFISECFETATKQAESSENRLKTRAPKSRIDGELFSVKDNFSTKSIATTCGSRMLANYVPPYDATVVERLNEAGACMMGKTNMDEFGMGSVSSSYFGTVKNPINLVVNKASLTSNETTTNDEFLISGGSSGGSAASVSSGLVSFSIASDTGGSIRNPASICGCIGYKPTYGLVSRFGLVPLNNYFDTVGVLARSMPVLVDVLNIISGPDPKDATSIKTDFEKIHLDPSFSPRQLRIGIPQEFFPAGLSESNHMAWQSAVDVILKNEPDIKIVPVSMPNLTFTMSVYSVLTSCEVASNFGRYDGIRYGFNDCSSHTNPNTTTSNPNFEKTITQNRNESLGKIVKSRIVSGNYFLLKENYEKYFEKSHQIKRMIVNDFRRVFESSSSSQVDIIVTPTCFHDTPTYAEYLKQEQVFDERDFFTACANIAGVPAISVPATRTPTRQLPIGVQFMTAWGRDQLLCNFSQWFIKKNSAQNNYDYNQIFSA